MKNLRDAKTKIYPSITRAGKELPSSSALDSPSVMSKFATLPPATVCDMSQVIDDVTSAMHDAYDDTLLDTIVPLGEFLDEHIARVNGEIDNTTESDETGHYDSPASPSSPIYDLLNITEGYAMEGDVARDFLPCKDRDDLKKLLCKWKEKTMNARMQYDPRVATSHIFVTDKDYEFSLDPELITLAESDPFHGYESETIVAHLTKLNDIATLFTHEEKFVIIYS